MKCSTALVRRTPLLHRAGLTRRSRPIRPESDRKAALSRDAAAARDLVRDRDGCCVLCGGPGVDAHHRLPRGLGGARWDPSRFALSRLVWLCRECHRWVESRRTLAYGLGLLVRHGVTPCSEIPLFRRGRWVLLADDGLVTPTDPPAASSSFAESRAAS
jgi:5-methylcytosine-specific restriction protein A